MSSTLKRQIKQDWVDAEYYERAESEQWMAPFWGDDSPFRAAFATLDHACILEIGCGHGRHASHIRGLYPMARMTLVDINSTNVGACQHRFKGDARISAVVTSGSDLPVPNTSHTAAFSYDAMVHFEYDDVAAYLRDLHRVLVPGGKALLHHSNNDKEPGKRYSDCMHWRNFMSAPLFSHMAQRAGLNVVSQQALDWGEKELDCLSLVQRPG